LIKPGGPWGHKNGTAYFLLPRSQQLFHDLEVQDVPVDEAVFTAEELAQTKKVHPSTIRRLFLDEPGVIRFGSGRRRGRRQYYTIRIPQSVAERVFRRMTVGECQEARQ
jgi:hypothetical protein